MQVSSNNINLEVQEFGHKDNIPLIMISGFGSQLCDWPINLINKIVEREFRVIIFDNRDVGLSHKFEDNKIDDMNLIWKYSFSREKLSKDARVKLSTIHSAKGGEADNVLLILDNTKTIRDAVEKSSDKQDEEHRVWYVGVTRTKQNLYIMAAKKEDKT